MLERALPVDKNSLPRLLPRRSLFAALGISATLLGVALLRADDKKTNASPKGSQLAHDAIGVWIQAGTPDKIEDSPSPKNPLKFVIGNRWSFTQPDPETGQVTFHHGGTYTIDGDTYEETIKFANENTANMIGQTFKYKLKVEGDTWTQTGIGNPYTQVWKRVK
jgi:hypothetical protein